MAPQFRLVLLGGAALEGPQGRLDGRVAQPRSLALLALLALAPGGAITREKLIGYLWPEVDRQQGRHLLSNALYIVRRALADDAIIGSAELLHLNTSRISGDVLDLTEALGRGDLEAAGQLYAGPLLDGFYLSDAPEFERWLDLQRERLERSYATALERVAIEKERSGDSSGAVTYWTPLAALLPYDSRVATRLASALQGSGNPAGALRVATQHAGRVRQDLGIEPDGEVTRIVESLRASLRPQAPPARASASTPGGSPSATTDVPAEVPTANIENAPVRRGPRRAVPWLAAAVLLMASAGVLYAWRSTEPTPPGVAVLPFTNLGEPANEWFADGVHEEILTQVSRISSLRVPSRMSVMAYREPRQDLRQIARDLDVQYVVDGGIRRDGNRVLITVQLLDARTDQHLWNEQYERELSDIFAVQSDIARRVAAALSARLSKYERAMLASAPTKSITAYDYYLQGRAYASRLRPDDHKTAIDLYYRAIAADPRFAAAHAALSSTYGGGVWLGYVPREKLDSAFVAARTAIELDPRLPAAHNALGIAYSSAERYPEAIAAMQRAAELDPNAGGVRTNIGVQYQRMGHYDEALRWYTQAIRLNAALAPTYIALAYSYTALSMFAEARTALEQAASLAPDLYGGHHVALRLGMASGDSSAVRKHASHLSEGGAGDLRRVVAAAHGYVWLGELSTARTLLQRVYAIDSTATWQVDVRVLLGYTNLRTGREREGRAMLERYLALYADSARRPLQTWRPDEPRYGIAAAYAVLNRPAEAAAALQSFGGGSLFLNNLVATDPMFAAVRTTTAFQAVLREQAAELRRMRSAAERLRPRG
jgi:TolB-like protein/DNA-binding SARP family transcriptional activator